VVIPSYHHLRYRVPYTTVTLVPSFIFMYLIVNVFILFLYYFPCTLYYSLCELFVIIFLYIYSHCHIAPRRRFIRRSPASRANFKALFTLAVSVRSGHDQVNIDST